jgi:beta-1,4-mannosyl-glycoprotein beta-1,4-N-acetylglucosaminyltransferase
MKIIDCFPYFNEEEHLILRINLLKDHVDGFVICEANRTHTGTLKEYTVEQVLKRNGILLDKIHIHRVELPSKEDEPDNQVRERKQRDEAVKLIKEDEIWFISDCDEILNPEYLDWYKKVVVENSDNIVRVRMTFHVGEANFQLFYKDTPIYWHVPFFVLKKHTDRYTLSEIRECISLDTKIDFPSIFITDNNNIVESGWHLSWMGSTERRITKLESFMHYDDFVKNGIGQLDTPQTKEFIQKFTPTENGVDILGRHGHILKNYDITKLPNLIFQNKKLKDFFVPDYIHHIYQNDF